MYHGTFAPGLEDDKLNYLDVFTFRHKIAGGGNARTTIGGSLQFVE